VIARRLNRMTGPVARAALFYAALTLVLTFPLILHLNSTVPHDLGDPLLSASLLWWNAHVLPLTERWWNGFAFTPATGMLAFSDHRLGMSLLASPLQWLGCSPITAYNVVFLSTFPLCAIGAHALAFTLTKRHDAALIAGLAYGFNPYRMAHLSHLELLAAYGMPAALAALHLFLRTRRPVWLGAFAGAFLVQALCSSYYMLFFSVFLALWLLWFTRVREWRAAIGIVVACGAVAAAMSPILLGYWRIHQHYDFARPLREVLFYSADVASLAAATPLLPVWRWTAPISPLPELQLFPGLTIVALAAAGFAAAVRRHPSTRDAWRWISLSLLFVACVFAIVAATVSYVGPWEVSIAGLRITATVAFKPITVALMALAASLAARPWARAAWHERSELAFYLLAAGFLFLCSLGPKPAFLGRQFLYKPPFEWLMNLPGFGGGVRAPARFAMPAVLALSIAAALAFNRLKLTQRARRAIAVAAAAGIVADGWIGHMNLAAVPDLWPVPANYRFGPVLELPLATDYGDFVAMYRASAHGHPAVNGNSGFFPPHYTALQFAFKEGDAAAFDAFTQTDPLLVVLDRRADPDGRWDALVRNSSRTTLVSSDERWTLFGIAQPPPAPACSGSGLDISSATGPQGPIDVSMLNDHNPKTWFVAKGSQHAGETLTVDLGRTARLCAVRMSLDTSWWVYPRLLTVATSIDAQEWTPRFSGSTAGFMVRGAIEHPRDVTIQAPAQSDAARFIRLRLEKSDASVPWFMTELQAIGTPR
jgi:hypothetical protein